MAQNQPTESDPDAQDAASAPDPAETAPSEPTAEQAAEAAMDQAQEAVDNLKAETTGGDATTESAMPLPDFGGNGPANGQDSAALALLRDVNLQVKVELGRTLMYVEDVLRLNENSVIELDKLAGDPVDVYVNERHVARGEVLVVNDAFCVRVSEIIQPIGDD
jgi:flagellar motor switch protein FliN/FliY